MLKCPKCQTVLEVRLTAAPPMQSDSVAQGSLKELLDRIDDGRLEEDAEINFVSQTRERFEKYGSGTRMSDKQMAWLQRIADRP